MPSIGEILERNAHRVPERTALIYGDRRLSYRELDEQVNKTARAIFQLDVEKGDRIALMAYNTDLFVIAYYALLKLGAIVVPINVRLAPPELAYQLQDSGARMILYDDELTAVVMEATKGTPTTTLCLHSHGETNLLGMSQHQTSDPLPITVEEDDDAQILYTSGTTGKPKGVLFDHHRIIWTGINITVGVGLRDGERLLHVAPLYHSAELDLFLMAGTFIAGTHVVMKEFNPAEVLKTMDKEQITAFFGVPTMYQFMLRDPQLEQTHLGNWRIGMFGAAPMPPSTVVKLAEVFPSLTLFNLAGLTELGPGGVFLGGKELLEHPDTAGRPIVNTEARVVGTDFQDVKEGEVGELILRGETLMKGYWNNPTATAATMRDGWLMTGDLATIDHEGRVIIIDRKKDMIITGGMNVYSVEVEYAIITHPSVMDCAVIGVPHADYGETVTAIVTLKPGAELDLEALRAYCRPLIADYKIPRRLILSTIPRNASGKVLKYKLREEYSSAQ